MRRVRLITVVFFLIFFFLLFFAMSANKPDGKAIFEKNCKSCHDVTGKGNPKVAKILKVDLVKLDLTKKETSEKKDSELIKTVSEGSSLGKMNGFKEKLSREEITAVVSHVRSLKK